MTRSRALLEQSTATRADRVQRAKELRARPMLLREVAAEMGVAIQTVHSWLSDPDGSKLKARKDSYRGTCEKCGQATDGSNGAAAAPSLCVACTVQKMHDERHWTAERLIEEVQRFASIYGRPPRELDWNPRPSNIIRRTNQWKPEGKWPSSSLAPREFGSWNAMIAAAGFRPFDHAVDHEWGAGRPLHGPQEVDSHA